MGCRFRAATREGSPGDSLLQVPRRITEASAVGNDEHSPERKQHFSLIVRMVDSLESLQATGCKSLALLVIGQALERETHRRAADPVENGAGAVHDLQILGLPDIEVRGDLTQRVVVNAG